MAIALYARKSIERENSISCETQLEYCKAMIKPDEQHEKIVAFVDNGFSGGNVNRDGFQKMMSQIESGSITKVIVYRLDRISRSLGDFVNILNTLKKYNVKFISSQESFDTSSPYGEMIVKILMVFAEFERQSIIERVTQAYAHRSEMKIYMGGRRPYGFSLTDTIIHNINTKMLSPVPEEIEQLKYIFEVYSVPGVTLRRLMDNLITNNIMPSDGNWSTGKLSTILKNPIYVRSDNSIYEYFAEHNTNIISEIAEFDGIHGLQIYGRNKHSAEDWSDMKAVVMTHEGVIASDVWLKCQKKLDKNKQIGNSASNDTSWLGGKIKCKSCGRTMTVTKGGIRKDGTKMRYFSCTGKSHTKSCKGTSVTNYADSLENMVYNEIAEKLKTLKNVKIDEHKNLNPAVNELRNKVKGVELAQQKLADTILNTEVSSDLLEILNKRAANLKTEKLRLLARIEEIEDRSEDAKTVINLSNKWECASFKEKKDVCNILIDRIVIDENGDAEILWYI